MRQLTVSQVIGALDAAIRAGPSVINMSFGVPYSRLFEDLVLTAFGAGSIVVAAAGNERQQGNTAASPANLNHVLTVAATDRQDRPTTFSTASLGVDLAAPGVDIPAAVPTAFSQSGYSLMAGTSFSAPIVTGATAWVWTMRPQLDNTQVFDLMRYSARDVAPQGFDRDTGFGLLDIPSALGDEAPSSDLQEPNDDIRHVRAGGLFGRATTPITAPGRPSASFTARLDVTEDPEDVYRVYVPAGRRVRVTVMPDTDVDVDLWRPVCDVRVPARASPRAATCSRPAGGTAGARTRSRPGTAAGPGSTRTSTSTCRGTARSTRNIASRWLRAANRQPVIRLLAPRSGGQLPSSERGTPSSSVARDVDDFDDVVGREPGSRAEQRDVVSAARGDDAEIRLVLDCRIAPHHRIGIPSFASSRMAVRYCAEIAAAAAPSSRET